MRAAEGRGYDSSGSVPLRKAGEIRVKALSGLTGVRGVAALGVFLCHLQPICLVFFALDPSFTSGFIASGFRGVDLFFVLSGFILFHVHSAGFRAVEADELKRFYLLRFFRVYPLNTVVLLLMLPLPFFLPQFVEWHRLTLLPEGAYHLKDFSLAAFVQSITLSQAWTHFKPGTWNEPAWTLSAEIAGYAVFPFSAVRLSRVTSKLATTVLAALSLTAFVVLMVLFGHATNNPSGDFALVRMGTCFFAGMCLCRTYQLTTLSAASAKLLTFASIALIVVCFWWGQVGTLSVFGFGGLILGLAYEAGPIHRLMTAGPVMFLGKISFSFYLLHLIPLELADYFLLQRLRDIPVLVKCGVFAAVCAGIVLVAWLTYMTVEAPFQRLGRQMIRRSPKSASSSPVFEQAPARQLRVDR
jgi:peptidoglycan/LPS O-acetylase OafA/YrhL